MAKKIEAAEVPEGEESTPNKYAKDPTKAIKVVKFGATWCGHCVAMSRARTLEKLAEKYSDVEVIVVDVDKDEELADEYEVTAMPSIFFEDAAGYIVAEHSGALSFAEVEKQYHKAKAKIVQP